MDCGSDKLKHMVLAAQHVDFGLCEIQRDLSSVSELMPSEENQPFALDLMTSIHQETKEIEEYTHQLKVQLQEILASCKERSENARTSNNVIEDGIAHIVNTLSQYGYDETKMPDLGPPDEDHQDETYSSEDEEPSNIKKDNKILLKNEKAAVPPIDDKDQKFVSPSKGIHDLSESMLGSDIVTPLVLSNKSHSRRNGPSTTPVTPSAQVFKSHTPSCMRITTPRHIQSSAKSPLTLLPPAPPILSKATYELLGEEPPPEFYAQNRDN